MTLRSAREKSAQPRRRRPVLSNPRATAAARAASPGAVWSWFTDGAWILFAIYGSFGLLPFIIWGPIYQFRCRRSKNLLRGLGLGIAYAAYIYTFYITSWRALSRLIRGRNGWSKTRRNTEHSSGSAVALDH